MQIFLSAGLLKAALATSVPGTFFFGDVVNGQDRLSVGDKTQQADPAGNPRGWNCHRHKSPSSTAAANMCVCVRVLLYVINGNVVFLSVRESGRYHTLRLLLWFEHQFRFF